MIGNCLLVAAVIPCSTCKTHDRSRACRGNQGIEAWGVSTPVAPVFNLIASRADNISACKLDSFEDNCSYPTRLRLQTHRFIFPYAGLGPNPVAFREVHMDMYSSWPWKLRMLRNNHSPDYRWRFSDVSRWSVVLWRSFRPATISLSRPEPARALYTRSGLDTEDGLDGLETDTIWERC